MCSPTTNSSNATLQVSPLTPGIRQKLKTPAVDKPKMMRVELRKTRNLISEQPHTSSTFSTPCPKPKFITPNQTTVVKSTIQTPANPRILRASPTQKPNPRTPTNKPSSSPHPLPTRKLPRFHSTKRTTSSPGNATLGPQHMSYIFRFMFSIYSCCTLTHNTIK